MARAERNVYFMISRGELKDDHVGDIHRLFLIAECVGKHNLIFDHVFRVAVYNKPKLISSQNQETETQNLVQGPGEAKTGEIQQK